MIYFCFSLRTVKGLQGPVFAIAGAAEEEQACEADASQTQGRVCLVSQGRVLECWLCQQVLSPSKPLTMTSNMVYRPLKHEKVWF